MTTPLTELSSLASRLPRRVDPLKAPEARLRYMARELAMDIVEVENLLQSLDMDVEEWDRLTQHPMFKKLYAEEKERWNSSLNTKERVEIKTWSIIEMALEQFQQYLHDPNFSDNAKVALFTAMQKQVGIGNKEATASDPGQRVQIEINLGADHKLSYDKELSPPTIEHQAISIGAE